MKLAAENNNTIIVVIVSFKSHITSALMAKTNENKKYTTTPIINTIRICLVTVLARTL